MWGAGAGHCRTGITYTHGQVISPLPTCQSSWHNKRFCGNHTGGFCHSVQKRCLDRVASTRLFSLLTRFLCEAANIEAANSDRRRLSNPNRPNGARGSGLSDWHAFMMSLHDFVFVSVFRVCSAFAVMQRTHIWLYSIKSRTSARIQSFTRWQPENENDLRGLLHYETITAAGGIVVANGIQYNHVCIIQPCQTSVAYRISVVMNNTLLCEWMSAHCVDDKRFNGMHIIESSKDY